MVVVERVGLRLRRRLQEARYASRKALRRQGSWWRTEWLRSLERMSLDLTWKGHDRTQVEQVKKYTVEKNNCGFRVGWENWRQLMGRLTNEEHIEWNHILPNPKDSGLWRSSQYPVCSLWAYKALSSASVSSIYCQDFLSWALLTVFVELDVSGATKLRRIMSRELRETSRPF